MNLKFRYNYAEEIGSLLEIQINFFFFFLLDSTKFWFVLISVTHGQKYKNPVPYLFLNALNY